MSSWPRRGAALLLGLATLLFAEQGWLAVKGRIARVLIDRALEAHLADGRPHPPWRRADMVPLARLVVPRLGVRRTVLSGATGTSLAFGAGHIDGTAPPNRPGNCAIAGHRDRALAFLADLEVGDFLWLVSHTGRRRYRVTTMTVHREDDLTPLEATFADRLTLITCYPLNAITSGPLRYVVVCEAVGAARPRSSDRATILPGGRRSLAWRPDTRAESGEVKPWTEHAERQREPRSC